jgi:DNA-binding Lrp family transcriptional regulator
MVFVLINTNMGKEKEVVKKLEQIPQIKDIYTVYGEKDLIVRLQGETMEEIKNAVSQQIRGHNDVRSTMTLITVN